MKNTSFYSNKSVSKLILFVDKDTDNVEKAKKALQRSKIKAEINNFQTFSDFIDWIKNHQHKIPESIFLNIDEKNVDYQQILNGFDKLKTWKFIPLVFMTNHNQSTLNNDDTSNIVGVLNGPFNKKKFMDMVYSIRIYWDNLNTFASPN